MTLARIKYATILHLKRIKQGKLPTIRLSPVTSECKKGGDNDNLNVKKNSTLKLTHLTLTTYLRNKAISIVIDIVTSITVKFS